MLILFAHLVSGMDINFSKGLGYYECCTSISNRESVCPIIIAVSSSQQYCRYCRFKFKGHGAGHLYYIYIKDIVHKYYTSTAQVQSFQRGRVCALLQVQISSCVVSIAGIILIHEYYECCTFQRESVCALLQVQGSWRRPGGENRERGEISLTRKTDKTHRQ